jgi:hypothetical protein
MRVFGSYRSRFELDADLDDFAAGDTEIVPLEVDPLASSHDPRNRWCRRGRFGRLLGARHVEHLTTSDDQHCCRHDSCVLHVDLL